MSTSIFFIAEKYNEYETLAQIMPKEIKELANGCNVIKNDAYTFAYFGGYEFASWLSDYLGIENEKDRFFLSKGNIKDVIDAHDEWKELDESDYKLNLLKRLLNFMGSKEGGEYYVYLIISW